MEQDTDSTPVEETQEISETPEASEPEGENTEISDDSEQSESKEDEKKEEPDTSLKGNKGKKRIKNLTAENFRLKLRIEELEKTSVKETKPLEPPKEEDFDTYEDYLDARTDYRYQVNRAKESDDSKVKTLQEKVKERQATFDERASKFAEENEDFNEIVGSPDIVAVFKASPTLVEAIEESDVGPAIAYYLGNNIEEAIEIAQMSSFNAAKALGKLEVQLSAKPKPKNVSKAPEPINPVSGSGQNAGLKKDPEKMNPEEWREWRETTSKIKTRRS